MNIETIRRNFSDRVENQNHKYLLSDKDYLSNSYLIKYAKFAQLLIMIGSNVSDICIELTNKLAYICIM